MDKTILNRFSREELEDMLVRATRHNKRMHDTLVGISKCSMRNHCKTCKQEAKIAINQQRKIGS